VMEGEASFPLFPPEIMVMNTSFHPAVPLLPPIRVFHGKANFSIPHEAKYSDMKQLPSDSHSCSS
jgi:prenylcysteine alpha-carboxyl methylesterase